MPVLRRVEAGQDVAAAQRAHSPQCASLIPRCREEEFFSEGP